MTVRDLSARLNELGFKLSASGVSEIEKADRKVSTDELLILAIALNTSVIDLVMPAHNEALEVANETVMPAENLYLWLKGDAAPLPDSSSEEFVKAAGDLHKRMLTANGSPAVAASTALTMLLTIAQVRAPWAPQAATVPHIEFALAELTKRIRELIERLEEEGHGG